MRKTVMIFGFIMVATMIGKLLGLFRIKLMAEQYGTSMEVEAFIAASDIPLQFLELTLAAAITAVFIPIFNEYYQKEGKKRAISFASNFINIMVILSTLMAGVGMVLAPIVVKLAVIGFDHDTYLLTIKLTRILFPMIVFTSITYTVVGILQSFDEFNVPATISVISNLAIITYLIFFNDRFGVFGLAVMYVVGWGLQLFYQLPFVFKKGYRHQLVLDFKSPGMIKAYKMFVPILISSWVVPVNKMATNFFASFIDDGVTILFYSNQIYIIIVGVFSMAIGNLIFPSLSRNVAESNHEGVKTTLRHAVKSSIFILTPLMVGIILFSKEVMKILYQSQKFTTQDVLTTSTALMCFAIGMIGFGMREILNRAFYAINDTKTPLYCGLFGMVVNVILCGVLSFTVGYAGLALANAISVTIIGLMLLYKLQKTPYAILRVHDLIQFMKILIATSVMGSAVYFLRNNFLDLFGTSKIQLFLAVGVMAIIGFVLYFIIAMILGVDETKLALGLLGKKERRSR